jgi:hypothetical protein
MAKTLKALGLCMGASTVSLVQVEQDLDAPGMPSPRIIHHSLHTHEGDPKRTLVRALSGLDMRAQFLNWLYNGSEPTAATGRAISAPGEVKPEDLDPPWLARRHGQTGGR